MALKKKKGEGGDDAGAGKKGKKDKGGKGNLVPALVVAAGLVLGGKMMGGGGAAATPEAGSAEAASSTTTTVLGPVVVLDSRTVNLVDRHYLKVGLALQLSAEAEAGGAHGEAPKDDPTKGYARAIDIAIDTLGGKTFDQLVAPGGRDAAKKEVGARLEEAYHGEIEAVYFTEFVMQ